LVSAAPRPLAIAGPLSARQRPVLVAVAVPAVVSLASGRSAAFPAGAVQPSVRAMRVVVPAPSLAARKVLAPDPPSRRHAARAPAAAQMRARQSQSLRVASSAENSPSSTNSLAYRTAATAKATTSSGVLRSL